MYFNNNAIVISHATEYVNTVTSGSARDFF